MSDDLVDIGLAKLAKENGFDVKTNDFFVNGKSQSDNIFLQYKDDDCFIWQPTLYLLSKWLIVNHKIHVMPYRGASGWRWRICRMDGSTISDSDEQSGLSYEDVFRQGLYAALSKLNNISLQSKDLSSHNFTQKDWNHFHDVILDVTCTGSAVDLNQEQMEALFLELPEEAKQQAKLYGMSDMCWLSDLWDWYAENKMSEK